MSAARAALLLAALVAAAPLATAGTREAPDIRDASGDAPDSAADIVAAWLQAEEAGLRFSIQTRDGSLPDRNPGYVYWIQFRAGGVTSSAAVGFDARARFLGYVGPLDGPNWARGDFGTVANGKLVGLTQARGQPSTWSAIIPWGAVPGLQEGATLVDITVGSARYTSSGGWQGGIDGASTGRAFVAEQQGFAATVRDWGWAIVAGGALLGVGLGYVGWRRWGR